MGREVEVEQRVKPLLEADLKKAGLRYGAPVFLRIFKREKELELWMQGDGKDYVLFRSYPICTYSGELGPKLRQGAWRLANSIRPAASTCHSTWAIRMPTIGRIRAPAIS